MVLSSSHYTLSLLDVLMVSFGSLAPLTSDHGDEPVPKALLPIGNEPMLSYSLRWLEQSGVKGMRQTFYFSTR